MFANLPHSQNSLRLLIKKSLQYTVSLTYEGEFVRTYVHTCLATYVRMYPPQVFLLVMDSQSSQHIV